MIHTVLGRCYFLSHSYFSCEVNGHNRTVGYFVSEMEQGIFRKCLQVSLAARSEASLRFVFFHGRPSLESIVKTGAACFS